MTQRPVQKDLPHAEGHGHAPGGLPREFTASRIQHLFDRAPRVLSQRRTLHLLGVTHTAATLAALHGVDVELAVLAGLLHDQSKELPPKQLLEELIQMGEPLTTEDLEYPHIWHGFHAAAYARTRLGLNEPGLLEAVRLHTTADAGVGPLTWVLFVADLCEPNRPNELAPGILRVARRDLAEGFREALRQKTRHVLRKKNAALHPRGIRALRAFLNLEPAQLEAAPL